MKALLLIPLLICGKAEARSRHSQATTPAPTVVTTQAQITEADIEATLAHEHQLVQDAQKQAQDALLALGREKDAEAATERSLEAATQRTQSLQAAIDAQTQELNDALAQAAKLQQENKALKSKLTIRDTILLIEFIAIAVLVGLHLMKLVPAPYTLITPFAFGAGALILGSIILKFL